MTTELEPIYFIVGKRIRQARKAVRVSQQVLAEDCGVSRCTINNIENGRQRPPLHLLAEMADVLCVPLKSLLPD